MNLAPHAIEEWDNESLSLSVSQCVGCMHEQYVYSLFYTTLNTIESIVSGS